MFSFTATNVMYVSLLCATQHLLVLTTLNSDNAEFLAYIKFKYVTRIFFFFTTQSRLNPTAAITKDCSQQSS